MHVARRQQVGLLEPEVAQSQPRREWLRGVECIGRVDAPALEHAERAGEAVLVDAGGAVEPVQRLDVEPPAGVDGDRGLAERAAGVRLRPELVLRPVSYTHLTLPTSDL